jgi:hypothetical protein
MLFAQPVEHCFKLGHVLLNQRTCDQFFRRKELVKRTDRGVRARGDRSHRRCFVPFFGEFRTCGFQQRCDPRMATGAARRLRLARIRR